jgi:hypothetical protein
MAAPVVLATGPAQDSVTATSCAVTRASAVRRVISATSLGIERIVELVIPPGS